MVCEPTDELVTMVKEPAAEKINENEAEKAESIENEVEKAEPIANIPIKFAKINEESDAKIPSKRDEDAGYDVYPCFDDPFMRIPAHKTILVPTGIASALPVNYYFQIEERGSTGSKGLKKSAGVIDSGYRGEWFIAITNANHCDAYIAKQEYVAALKDAAKLLEHDVIIYPYEKGIAQAVLIEVPRTETEVVSYDVLKEIASERGVCLLGSSQK